MERDARVRRHMFLIAAVAGLGGLLFGYDTGVIASALLFIRHSFDLSGFEQGVVVAVVPLGAAAGAVLAARIAERWGRKRAIIVAGVIFIVGSAGSAAAPDAALLVVSRLAIGLAIGFASATSPVYVSEVAPSEIRGRLVALFQLAVTVGILLAYLVGLAFEPIEGWRWMLGLGAVPAILLVAGVAVTPHSPRWLMLRGRREEARTTLGELREAGTDIEEELETIEAEARVEASHGWSDLLRPAVRAALVVGVGLAILQQVTGINTVIYYAPTIFQFTGIDSDAAAIAASLAVGVVNVVATLFAVRLLDRSGRRRLLLVGVAGMSISLFVLGSAFLGRDETTFAAVVALVSLLAYIASFAISLGAVFWVLNGEIYPLFVRARAAAVGTMANWTANFAVSLTFLVLISAIGRTGTFWFYAAVGALTWVFCLKLVPETKGRSLEEITGVFARRAGEAER